MMAGNKREVAKAKKALAVVRKARIAAERAEARLYAQMSAARSKVWAKHQPAISKMQVALAALTAKASTEADREYNKSMPAYRKLGEASQKHRDEERKLDAAMRWIGNPLAPMPQGQAFICYKKAETTQGNVVIITLRVPAHAKRRFDGMGRLGLDGRKCRCSEAKVLKMEYLHDRNYGPKKHKAGARVKGEVVRSQHNKSFTYQVGAVVKPRGAPFSDQAQICASGIHFYMRREDAVRH